VKRLTFSPQWLGVGLSVLLALTACERPVPREELPETPDVAVPTTAPFVIPTPIPTSESETTTPPSPETGEPGNTAGEEQPPADQPAGDGAAASGETTGVPGEASGAPTSHTVQAGDTLGAIAERYDVSIEEIAAANNLTNIDSLDIGQVLIIPVPGSEVAAPGGEEATPAAETGERTHVVKAGENLFRIGLVYGFTVDELASYNGIADPTRLEIGQVLRIPPAQ
jgi:LysM repeat protein